MPVHYFSSIEKLAHSLNQKRYNSEIIITDDHCNSSCVELVLGHLTEKNPPVFVFQSGEANKNSNTFLDGIEFLASQNASRDTLIYNIGGGVTTDLGGLVAATYKRGVSFINIPTSLMGMIDASHGGKVGINHRHLKNYIGSFISPEHIYICIDFLKTLDSNEMISGYAEILKHGLICDAAYWSACSNLNPFTIQPNQWLSIVQRSIEIKSNIVQRDFKEENIRKILNFGHTIGHAVESHFLKNGINISHGEAVACGMIMEAYLSYRISGLSIDELKSIRKTIDDIFKPIKIHHEDLKTIASYMRFDKKNDDNKIKMSLLKSIGDATYDKIVSPDLIYKSFEYYDTGEL